LLSKEKLARLNELAKKSKNESLTDEELVERDELRKEYLETFRVSFRKRLENIDFVDEDGNVIQKYKN
jgi:uncharacterized protein YnzC (UPF0291/DUF896 family)